jgi:hypothetical protein
LFYALCDDTVFYFQHRPVVFRGEVIGLTPSPKLKSPLSVAYPSTFVACVTLPWSYDPLRHSPTGDQNTHLSATSRLQLKGILKVWNMPQQLLHSPPPRLHWRLCRVFQKELFQMLLCGECYESVRTIHRSTLWTPLSVNVFVTPRNNILETIVKLFLKHGYVRYLPTFGMKVLSPLLRLKAARLQTSTRLCGDLLQETLHFLVLLAVTVSLALIQPLVSITAAYSVIRFVYLLPFSFTVSSCPHNTCTFGVCILDPLVRYATGTCPSAQGSEPDATSCWSSNCTVTEQMQLPSKELTYCYVDAFARP